MAPLPDHRFLLPVTSSARDGSACIMGYFWLHFCAVRGSADMSSIFIQWSVSSYDSLAPNRVEMHYHLLEECNILEQLLNEGIWSWKIGLLYPFNKSINTIMDFVQYCNPI